MSGQEKSGTKGQSAPAPTAVSKKGGKCRGGCAHPPTASKSVPQPQSAVATIVEAEADDKGESLRKENSELKSQQKELEAKLDELQVQLDKTNLMNTRLEGLCSELKNRTKALTTESSTKILDAEQRGKTLTDEVSQNLGLMNNINDSIQQITKDNLESRKFNESLSYQIANMKSEHEKKEALIQEQIQETHEKIIKAHMDLAQTKLDNSQDKEKTFLELKKLATSIVESREQMQTIKQTELTLRQHIQNYDEKFVGLQTALKETNAAYDGFKGDMEKLAEKAKALEGDATKWHNRWEESNCALALVEKTHARLQAEIERTTVSLQKMTSLYKALQNQQNQAGETPSGSPKQIVETPAASGEALLPVAKDAKALADTPNQNPVSISGQNPETGAEKLSNKSETSPALVDQVPPETNQQASQAQQQSNAKSSKKKRKGKNK